MSGSFCRSSILNSAKIVDIVELGITPVAFVDLGPPATGITPVTAVVVIGTIVVAPRIGTPMTSSLGGALVAMQVTSAALLTATPAPEPNSGACPTPAAACFSNRRMPCVAEDASALACRLALL